MHTRAYDFFDLPDWVGTEPVDWSAEGSLTDQPRVPGILTAAAGKSQQLDLLAVDAAYPEPVCPDGFRRSAHQAWQFGQVQLLETDGRLTCAVPGTRFTADLACEVLRRVAKAVGAPAHHFTVSIAL